MSDGWRRLWESMMTRRDVIVGQEGEEYRTIREEYMTPDGIPATRTRVERIDPPQITEDELDDEYLERLGAIGEEEDDELIFTDTQQGPVLNFVNNHAPNTIQMGQETHLRVDSVASPNLSVGAVTMTENDFNHPVIDRLEDRVLRLEDTIRRLESENNKQSETNEGLLSVIKDLRDEL